MNLLSIVGFPSGLWLFLSGLAVSVFGSIVGLGGGFLLVPGLRLFAGLTPAAVAGTSLALVVTNNATASVTYFRQRRIRIWIGLRIAAGGLPGSVFGALAVKAIPVRAFDWLLAALTFAVAIDILRKARTNRTRRTTRRWHDVWYAHVAIGFIVGVLSGLFGAGGGIVLIPALFYFSDMSPHEVTATGQFAIIFISACGLATHVQQHDLQAQYAVPLVLGALLGGPIGARLSMRIRGGPLLVLVALSLIVAAASLATRGMLQSR